MDTHCTFTVVCPLPASSDRHLPGCPSLTVTAGGLVEANATPFAVPQGSGAPMFPEPQMDYATNPAGWRDPGVPMRAVVWWPSEFVLGFGFGLATAGLAVFVGFALSYL